MKNKLTKLLSLLLSAGMALGMCPAVTYAADAGVAEESSLLADDAETTGTYGYLNLTYAEFYTKLVDDTSDLDAVTVATVASTDENGNATHNFKNAWVDFQDASDVNAGYYIYGVKNVPVKLENYTETDAWLTEREFTAVSDGTELSQYATLSYDSSSKSWKVTDWTFNEQEVTSTYYTDELSTAGTWGEYQINIRETSGNLLRNSRSDTNSETGEPYAINSEIMGILITAVDSSGNEVTAGTGHMANIWYQPWEVSFGVTVPDKESGRSEAYNNKGFAALVGKTVTKITYIMPDTTYVYDLTDTSKSANGTDWSVYVKESFAGLSATWEATGETLADGSAAYKLVFASGSSISKLTNPKISIFTKTSGRNAVTTYLLEGESGETTFDFSLSDTYTLTAAFPDGSDGLIPKVLVTSDSHADFYVSYPMLDWQRTVLTEYAATAKTLISQINDNSKTETLEAHRAEATALLKSSSATAQEAEELIGELEELIEAVQALVFTVDDATYVITEEGAEVQYAGTTSTSKSVKIPATVTYNDVTYKVTSIAASAFKNNTTITKVTIGKNVTEIPASAFYGCTKLKTVSIGAGVTSIGNKAFAGCVALTSITIPSKVTSIGKQAFKGDKKLATITIKSTKLTSVGANAFKGIKATAKIKVPKAKLTKYTKLLKGKGQGSKVTIVGK